MENNFTGYRRVFYSMASQLGYTLIFSKNINDTRAIKYGNEIKKYINPKGNIVFRDGSDSIELCGEIGLISRIGNNLTIAIQKTNDSNKLLFIIRDKLQEKHIVFSIPDVAENNSNISVSVPKKVGTGRRDYNTMEIKFVNGKCEVLSNKNYEGKESKVEYSVNEYIEQIEKFLIGSVKLQDAEALKDGFELIKPVIEFQISSYLINGNLLRQANLESKYNSKREKCISKLEFLYSDENKDESKIEKIKKQIRELDEEYYSNMEALKEQIEYLYEVYDNVLEKQKTA